jgi:hypothetical protein
MGPSGSMRDRAGFHNVAKQTEIGEVKAHGPDFAFYEG